MSAVRAGAGFTPTDPQHFATKAYVDSKAGTAATYRTANSGSSTTSWARFARVSVPAVGNGLAAELILLGAPDGNDVIDIVNFKLRVGQRAAFGNNPAVDVAVMRASTVTTANLGYVVTSNAGPTVVDFYVQLLATNRQYNVSVDATSVNGNATITYVDQETLVTSTPAGLVAASYSSDPAYELLPNVQVFTASGTWTRPVGALSVTVEMVGGGGGGGSGRRTASGTAASGGAGGGGGGYSSARYPAAALTATVTVTVGVGGNGGAAVTVDSTNGNAGAAGSASTFGGYLVAGLGGAGAAGSTVASTGGVTQNQGGHFYGGAGGAGAISAAGAQGSFSQGGAGGGGAGGGLAATPAASNGGGGGGVYASPSAGNPPGTTATAGLSGNSPGSGMAVAGTGATGGGALTNAASYGGGAGGVYGGGGGGGGASVNGFASGAGGKGGNGLVVVTSW